MKIYKEGFASVFLVIALALIGFVSLIYFAYKNGQVKITPNYCEAGKEYQSNSEDGECECPPNYKKEAGIGWGKCPREGMRDCPSATFQCVPGTATGWKKYTNNDLGIEFEYRPDLTIEHNSSQNEILLTNKTDSVTENYENYFYASISELNLGNLSPKQYALTNLCGTNTTDPFWSPIRKSCQEGIEKNFKEYQNNEVDGFEFKYNPYENTSYVVIFKNKNNEKYLMLSSSTETGGDGPTRLGQDTIRRILSTLRFTKLNCKEGEILKECKLGPCCCPVGAICD